MKYKKIVQKKYCCVGACLEMVLNRHHIKNSGQEDIAYQLGLIVPYEDKDDYKKVRSGKMPIAGYGTQIQEEQYSINNFFKKNKISLVEKYYYLTDYEEAKEFLYKYNDYDILIIFHCGTLYDNPNADWGHMILFERIENDEVTILENGPKRDIEKVTLEKLLDSIKIHGKEKGAGFYLIEKRI